MDSKNFDYNKFRVTFISINVTDDGDDFSAGDISYTFQVENETFNARPLISASSGETITLTNLSKTFIKNHDESFTVFGTVSDIDDFATGGNDLAGSFTDTYSGNNGWWTGIEIGTTKTVSHRLNQDGMDVTVNYKIEYLEAKRIIKFPPPPPPPPPPANIADGGVLLYEGENYNSKLKGTDKLGLITPSQFFELGDYNLPLNIGSPGEFRPKFRPGLQPKTAGSIKIGTQIQVTLYDRPISERHLGTSIVLFEDVAFLNRLEYNGIEEGGENGWNNKVMSIKVEHNEIRVQ